MIKANASIAGLITTDGWIGYMLPGHELVAPRDATIVAKLRNAGAILVGVTNMPDFAASDTTRSTAFGRTGNAYDVRFSPGGSSGGAVTAVTANFAVLGNGTDTGNSIRMPVATSNLVGIFPTAGLSVSQASLRSTGNWITPAPSLALWPMPPLPSLFWPAKIPVIRPPSARKAKRSLLPTRDI